MTLEGLRQDIDIIDTRIMALLDERLERGLLTRRHKTGTRDPAREAEVLDRVARRTRCLAGREFTESLYQRIIAESRTMQERELRLVGFQGMHGAYSEAAARAWDTEAATIPFKEFSQVFDAVVSGDLDFGVVPVENTLGGIVGQVNSILVTTELRVVAAIDMPIDHCLLAAPGSDHRDIRTAYSHRQALSQCRRFLDRNKLDGIDWFDTAGAARMIAEDRPKGAAAIASRFAAELYGLEIIKEGVQDSSANRTRFFVLAKGAAATGGNKCSAVFFTDDKAGALFGVLEVFAKAGINLTRIESVPDEPGDYAIFIDFDGSDRDARVAEAIEAARGLVRDFRLLGCYDERKL
ncbi:MAG: bifunctional chorismate mutase/prephenate dehydratase [Spirochaetae bacterium HGW-Spirochaetae-3]|jgi:prephenate dehydratase/chorismate mutase/prephenate dehydratase|nr:MAG: bifunctional chorismate mutase/prephenate dehydratase [Spirochaetae bacterium HGW-Spirochaetae-3]